MLINYAAHVDHPINHSSNLGQLTLSLAAVAIAAAVVIYSGGTALVVLTAEGASTVATAGSVGMTAGKIVDSFVPPAAECYIKSGLESVLLGPSIKPAARADAEDSVTRGRHTDKKMAEGSKIVMLGPLTKPMSRRGDRTECGGTIVDGIHSILVGGEPSKQGIAINEEDSMSVKVLSAILDLVGGATTMAKGGALNAARGALTMGSVPVGAAGNDDAAKLMKAAGLGRPNGWLEWADSANTALDGAKAATNVVTGGGGGP
jgi:hypothetical protein